MNALLDRYGELLREVDAWFQRCLEQHPDLIACRNGCSECCRGLFDITLLDAFYLKRGFDRLPKPLKTEIVEAAFRRLEQLSTVNADFTEPWLLNGVPEEDWDALMPEEDETPCLLLSENGGCLAYEYRPMTCRLNGIPLIDVSGEELFDEWCTLNFTETDPRQLAGLRFSFNDLFARELLLFRELICLLTGTAQNEVDLFIPAALVMDYKKIVPAVTALN
ncbi:MAG: YkgJ family cysteine cluster protein [Desulfuromonadaceae bacterium]|nr:YkgJ family cysteine cluster protein [Desulfuromonadaceae bacterium]MDD2846988.1 YkgJ family cysteine cluster protein [Desulfuromonadaceae bacterium]MDD4129034.1 YkgJ family cysteine cluster protein [Desulfuromonadaceae bacterium]